MTEKSAIGCARPTGGPVGEDPKDVEVGANKTHEEIHTMIKVGKKAPDFTAPGYHNGDFTSIKLSEYLGKWVLLCFYPGDFTFV